MNAFVSVDTTRLVAPLLRHARPSYRRDDERGRSFVIERSN